MSATNAERMIDALLDLDQPTKIAAQTWAAENLHDPHIAERDTEAEFWLSGWRAAGEAGHIGVMVPDRFGGHGGDLFDTLLTMEGLGYGTNDAGLTFALSGHVWTVQPLLEQFGSDALCERWLPGLSDGSTIAAFSISEPDSGSDTFAMQTTGLVDTDGSIVINGAKTWVTMGPVADVFIVFVMTAPERGRWGVSAVMVERDTPGLTVGANRPKMGLRTTPFGDLTFADCRVPADAVIGKLGAGAAIFATSMQSERAYMLAGQIGAMERQLDDAVTYAHERRQFDQPIVDFQAVSHRLADMRLRHESARLHLYRTALLDARGESTTQAASLAKLQASEAAVASSLDALRTYGARGYVTGLGVEQDLRNVAGGVVLGGTSDIQRNIIAGTLKPRR